MNNKPFFSICIPTYEMRGMGLDFLKFNLFALDKQTFKNFEIVISDHSQNDDIKNLCDQYNLNIKYLKNINNVGSSSSNLNNSILNANGEWIKIIFQDDFLYGKNALEDLNNFILENFNCETTEGENHSGWVVTSCEHTVDGINFINPYEPRWSEEAILKGHNTISSPSVLCFKNEKENTLLFDENLNWLMDIEYYYRLFLKYGEPKIMKKINAVNRVWDGSQSSILTQEEKDKEVEIFKKRYIIN